MSDFNNTIFLSIFNLLRSKFHCCRHRHRIIKGIKTTARMHMSKRSGRRRRIHPSRITSTHSSHSLIPPHTMRGALLITMAWSGHCLTIRPRFRPHWGTARRAVPSQSPTSRYYYTAPYSSKRSLQRDTSMYTLKQNPPGDDYEVEGDEQETDFLRGELAKLESFEEILDELEELKILVGNDQDNEIDFIQDDDELELDDIDIDYSWDPESLSELLSSIQVDEDDDETYLEMTGSDLSSIQQSGASRLEQALLQGVVPVSAKVGSNSLPGDFGFDPLELATKDYFKRVQTFLLNLLPKRDSDDEDATDWDSTESSKDRPSALILRDYREAEIRHGRLAMLSSVFWPLQEMLDRLVLDDSQFGPLLYGPVTLPYFPLFMTAIMLLLGYLDIYSQSIKDYNKVGDAYLPGDCFWDPLRILQGAPDSMKRRMQERELFNGRASMLAFASFTWEELMSHKPLIEIEGNVILFEPLYQVPYIQSWLDAQFAGTVASSSQDMAENMLDSTDMLLNML